MSHCKLSRRKFYTVKKVTLLLGNVCTVNSPSSRENIEDWERADTMGVLQNIFRQISDAAEYIQLHTESSSYREYFFLRCNKIYLVQLEQHQPPTKLGPYGFIRKIFKLLTQYSFVVLMAQEYPQNCLKFLHPQHIT